MNYAAFHGDRTRGGQIDASSLFNEAETRSSARFDEDQSLVTDGDPLSDDVPRTPGGVFFQVGSFLLILVNIKKINKLAKCFPHFESKP